MAINEEAQLDRFGLFFVDRYFLFVPIKMLKKFKTIFYKNGACLYLIE